MKIYISLPITGHDIEKVEASCIFASGVITKKGHTPVSPLKVSPNPDASYAQHIGNDIEELLGCDAILLLPGWAKSKGCRLEYNCALIYGKQVFYSLEEIDGHKPKLLGKDEISSISGNLRSVCIGNSYYIDKLHLLVRVVECKGDGVPCTYCALKSISKNYSQCPFLRSCTAFSRSDNTPVYFPVFRAT